MNERLCVRRLYSTSDSVTARSVTMPAPLPPEIWWKILLESVVEMALQSDSPASLNKSLTQHALVCRHWASCVDDPIFRRQAKRLLCRHGAYFYFISSTSLITPPPRQRGLFSMALVVS